MAQSNTAAKSAFFTSFDPPHRILLRAVAEPLELERGAYLLRRGDPGGDLYLLLDGALEVVDSRRTPEVILAVTQPGQVVGELAFIDESPRTADVRAAGPCVVLRWARDDLRSLLGRNPDLAARFYELVARKASRQVRDLGEGAFTGAYAARTPGAPAGLQHLQDEARALAEEVKTGLLDLDHRLRQDAADVPAQQALQTLLDRLQSAVAALFEAYPDIELRGLAGELVARELHPYLVRSAVAERCIRRPQETSGTAEIMAHVFVNTAAGDGRLGELLDRWLLDRPTLAALRAVRQPTIDLITSLLPLHRNRRVLLINAGTGSLAAHLVAALRQAPTLLTLVDQSREALAFLDAGMVDHGGTVQLHTVQENLGQLAMGRLHHDLPEQDAILVHGQFEYLPERLAISLAGVCRSLLRPSGVLVASALSPSPDQALLDRLLEWPTVRRSEEAMKTILRTAGLELLPSPSVPAPAILVAGARPELNESLMKSAPAPGRDASGPPG